MDVMKEDMQKVDVTEENAGDRMRWRQMIFCGTLRLHPLGLILL